MPISLRTGPAGIAATAAALALTALAALTGLAEELASRGYVVASADHPYESTGTQLPDGRVLTCAACDRVDAQPDDAARREVLFQRP
ncbi:hypothetical protein [Streptomyces sp. NPDC048142]|uniref:hypothetical protein n=1 Tax=Streptomyces sp. NPDC048142 TaxID=3365501 RepID=UPI0037242A69